MLDLKRSKKLANKIQARNKACWQNAYEAMLLLSEDCIYVEGWIVVTKYALPIEHGYLRTATGQVIDPTPAMHEEGNEYFDGARYTISEMTERCNEPLPLVWNDYGWGGNNHPGYVAARDAALARAAQIAPKQPD